MKSNRVNPLLENEAAEQLQLGNLGISNEGMPTSPERFKKKAKKIASVKAITQAKLSTTQWKDKATRFVMKRSRSKRSRQRGPFNVIDTLNGRRKYKQATLSDIEDDEESTSNETFEDGVATPNQEPKAKSVDSHSKALLHYFAKVSVLWLTTIILKNLFARLLNKLTNLTWCFYEEIFNTNVLPQENVKKSSKIGMLLRINFLSMQHSLRSKWSLKICVTFRIL